MKDQEYVLAGSLVHGSTLFPFLNSCGLQMDNESIHIAVGLKLYGCTIVHPRPHISHHCHVAVDK